MSDGETMLKAEENVNEDAENLPLSLIGVSSCKS